jgi:hypothetical protein
MISLRNAAYGLSLTLMAASAACDDEDADASARRTGDASTRDASTRDASTRDAGTRATGGRDASAQDAGQDSGAEVDVDAGVHETPWQSLIDEELTHLYRYLPSHGRDVDPDGVFKVEDGVLHVLGNAPPAAGKEQEFGYVGTREEFGDYQLRLDQRWGTTKFAPRAEAVRDSGLLYHTRGTDVVWPTSLEFQIQEQDIGDLFLLGGTGATTRVSPDNSNVFQEGGSERTLRDGAVEHGPTMESLTDWNVLQLIASGHDWAHIVNGYLAHRGYASEYREGESTWKPLDRGRIVLQAEGAEVFYRDLRIRPLPYTPAPSGALVLFDGKSVDAFRHGDGSAPKWKVVDGALEVEPGSGDLYTRELLGSVRLHIEFRVPLTADANAGEQDRGNSGVYFQDRYEVQVLDSFGRTLEGNNDCGAIYEVRDAQSHQAFPAELWQAYDIVFRARTRRAPARLSVFWNGTEVQHEVELPDAGTQGDAPLRLQDHGQRVRYRNVWLQRL